MPRMAHAGAGNFAWLVADKGVRLVLSVVVGFAVARHLMPAGFGILNFALAITGLCLPLVDLGLDALIKRRLITEPKTAGAVLAVVRRLKFAAACLIYALIALIVLCLPDDGPGRGLVLITGLLLFQPAGRVEDLWLQSGLRAKVSVLSDWCALAVSSMMRLGLIYANAGVDAFAWVAVAEAALGCGLLAVTARRKGLPAMVASPVASGNGLLKESWPLLLSGLVVAAYMKLDVVMLRQLAGDREAGVYAAAVRLSEIGYFVPMALAASVLPSLMARRAERGAGYARAMQRFYDLNALLAYGFAVTVFLTAGWLIDFSYGAAYMEAASILCWHAWAAVFVYLGVARGQHLINEGRTVFALIATAVGACINIGLNMLWIPYHGGVGAAWATLVAYGTAAWLTTWFPRGMRGQAIMQTRALLLPFIGWRYLLRK